MGFSHPLESKACAHFGLTPNLKWSILAQIFKSVDKNSVSTLIIQKRIRSSFVLFFVLISLSAFCHKEWVHQYQVRQAYYFLQNQIGNVPEIRDAIDFITPIYDPYNSSDAASPWQSPKGIWIGAWREDTEDPLYEYTSLDLNVNETSGTASVTHFWNADNGDEDAQNYIGIRDVPNAWTKAKAYLFGGHEIYIKKAETITVKLTTDVTGYPVEVPVDIDIEGKYYTYNDLIDFYKTGNCSFTAYKTLGIFGVKVPMESPEINPLPLSVVRQYAYHILGRVAHLLGDMSVPAHVHNHIHPCDLGRPDDYEQYMGSCSCSDNDYVIPRSGSYETSIPTYPCNMDCNEPQINFFAQNYSASTALTQGGLIPEFFDYNNSVDGIRYLFYSQNQLADFFPSGSNYTPDGSQSYPTYFLLQGIEKGDAVSGGNVANIISTQSLLDTYAAMGNNPPPFIEVNDIADQTFNYSIRAIATLFYWFAEQTNQSVTSVPRVSRMIEGPTVYPNPANDAINIKLLGERNAGIVIRDISGRVMEKINSVSSEKISIETYSPGLYTIEVAAAERTYFLKFVKK